MSAEERQEVSAEELIDLTVLASYSVLSGYPLDAQTGSAF